MLKFASSLFFIAWLIPVGLGLTGKLVWDNGLLWLPPILLMGSLLTGLEGWNHPEHRVLLLLLALLSFGSMLMYGVFYFYLFALVGK